MATDHRRNPKASADRAGRARAVPVARTLPSGGHVPTPAMAGQGLEEWFSPGHAL
jgi:hypothetical protein